MVAQFFRILRPGGILHMCCPHSLHPRHQAEVLDLAETGGHVRAGYTAEDYRRLLEPLGFTVERVAGIGPASVCRADRFLRAIRQNIGDLAALPLLPIALQVLKRAQPDPPMPFSLYVRAIKP